MASVASSDWPAFARVGKGGIELDISVVPNAKRTEVVGLHDGALRLRLQAPPVDGKANEALVRWLAEQLELSRSAIELVRGHASRRKTVLLRIEPTLPWVEILRGLLP
jgi:uncharacterized protein (TIGR00251 family)